MTEQSPKSIQVPLFLPEHPPSQAEIDAVLLTVDALPGKLERKDIIFILKGSRRSRTLFNQWYRLESYSALRHMTDDAIMRTVDYCFHDGWLRLVYDQNGKLLAVFDQKGWERIKAIWAERVRSWLHSWVDTGTPEAAWPKLKPIHTQIKNMVLVSIAGKDAKKLQPALEVWAANETDEATLKTLHGLLGT